MAVKKISVALEADVAEAAASDGDERASAEALLDELLGRSTRRSA